jgi:mono/diheme cytochrome c family protein
MKQTFAHNSLAATILLLAMVGLMLFGAGCSQRRSSDKPPIHLVPNMDNQPRYETQGTSAFFADGMAMRLPVAGTIARGHLITDLGYHTGRDADSQLVAVSPVPVSIGLLKRGQDRFDIYCSPCHGRAGDGQGAVSRRGMLPPPTYHDDRLRNIEDGHLFEVMTIGKGNMASYRYQVSTADRWAIVAYVRALQRSQNASFDDLPPAPTPPDEESQTE